MGWKQCGDFRWCLRTARSKLKDWRNNWLQIHCVWPTTSPSSLNSHQTECPGSWPLSRSRASPGLSCLHGRRRCWWWPGRTHSAGRYTLWQKQILHCWRHCYSPLSNTYVSANTYLRKNLPYLQCSRYEKTTDSDAGDTSTKIRHDKHHHRAFKTNVSSDY